MQRGLRSSSRFLLFVRQQPTQGGFVFLSRITKHEVKAWPPSRALEFPLHFVSARPRRNRRRRWGSGQGGGGFVVRLGLPFEKVSLLTSAATFPERRPKKNRTLNSIFATSTRRGEQRNSLAPRRQDGPCVRPR